MNIVDFSWPLISAACLTAAVIYFLTWTRTPALTSYLLISLAALSVAAIGHIELAAMHTDSPARYESLIRWGHVGIVVLVISAVAFIRLHYGVGSPTLALVGVASRVACLIPNFFFGANLNYVHVYSLETVRFLGADVRVAGVAEPNPWMALGSINALLLVVFIGHAIVGLSRRPPSRGKARAMATCASLLLFPLIAGSWAWLVVNGHIRAPLLFAPTFVAMLIVMCCELAGGLASGETSTERRDVAAKRLRDGWRRMSRILRGTGIGLFNWDLDSDRIHFSQSSRTLLGEAPGISFSSKDVIARIPLPDRNWLLDSVKRATADEDVHCEFRIATAGKSHRWLAVRGRIVADTNGRCILNGILVDITDRKDAESRFRLVVDASSGAQILVGPEEKVAFANQAAAEIFGYAPDELAGMDLHRLIVAGQGAGAGTSVTRSSIGVIDGGVEGVGVRKGAGTVPLKAMFNPVSLGSEVFLLVSLTDLSRKETAGDGDLLREEVAHLSRVALLATLSGSLVHELNQPLAAILANAQAARRILSRQVPDMNEVCESLEAIVENDKRATELIRRLRALLRKDNSSFRPFNVTSAVDEALRILDGELRARQIEVTVDASGTSCVDGDAIQIQQVLLNILMNACDSMEERPPPRHIALRVEATGDSHVKVSVTDQGAGIAADDIARVLLPFFTSKSNGLGLGLSICSTIVMAHGGDISVQSDGIGKGACVSFRLPLIVTDADPGRTDPGAAISVDVPVPSSAF